MNTLLLFGDRLAFRAGAVDWRDYPIVEEASITEHRSDVDGRRWWSGYRVRVPGTTVGFSIGWLGWHNAFAWRYRAWRRSRSGS